MATKHIAIEGNIAAGKTTLAHLIAPYWKNSTLALEPFDKNPFLKQFYNDPDKYALALELSFLALRYEQLSRLLQPSLFEKVVISDHSLFRSWVFAGVTLPESEFVLFERLYNTMIKSLKKPDVIIKISAPVERYLKQIKYRSRSFETGISTEYLQNIEKRYTEIIKQLATFMPVIDFQIGWVDLLNTPTITKRLVEIVKDVLNSEKQGLIPVVAEK
ncbi:MAG: deoxynucleoside kinase [Chlorobi bacterium]|nr:deoxynucleoside kinase [Chlorobiota bacterium]